MTSDKDNRMTDRDEKILRELYLTRLLYQQLPKFQEPQEDNS